MGTGRTKLAMCLQKRRGSSCGLPGPAVTWLWGSGQRKRANRSRQAGKNQKESPWLFLDIFWGQVGIGRGCTSVKSSDDGSWESLGEVEAQASAEGVAHLSDSRAERPELWKQGNQLEQGLTFLTAGVEL